ncbi:MAG: DNA-binding protein [Acidobacteria bacterium]|nr:MAG: DNA-binding protein [Acidobacteriota bacterium]
MLIEIRELELHPVDFKEEFEPGAVDLGPDIQQRTPLKGAGRAQLVEEHHGKHKSLKDIRLQGQLSTSLDLYCARCLEPLSQDIKRDFDLLYRPLGADAGKPETPVSSTDAEIGYYQGEGLLLEDALREQLLLALPLKVICREDCKGLCPQCGKNLNVEQCSCAEPVEDPRWSALKEIRDKLDH